MAALLARVLVLTASVIALCGASPQSYRDSRRGDGPAVTVHTMDCGRLFVRDADAFADDGSLKGLSRDMVNPCFLVRHPSGDLMWDVGLPDGLALIHGRMTSGELVLTMPQTLTSQLAALGLTTADIEYVSLSHTHVDHMGNGGLFVGATFIVDARERAFLARQDRRERVVAAAGRQGREVMNAFSVLERAKTIEIPPAATHDVFGDGSVVIYPAPGHTPGHRVLLVRLPHSGPLVLSGDMYHLAESRARRAVPRGNDRVQTLASMDAIEKLAAATGARIIRQHVSEDFYSLPAFPEPLR